MKVEFRIATAADLAALVALCNECFEEHTSIEYAKRIFEQTKNDPNHLYIVGMLGEEMVAHTKITIIPTIYEPMNTYAILNHVCVKPIYRRHNIATNMLDYVFQICRDRHCKKVELWSNNVRTAAHSCYKNYGFHLDEAGFFSKYV